MGNKNHGALVRVGPKSLMKRPEGLRQIVTPVSDVFETSDAFVVKLDLPGVEKERIHVTIEPGRLSVKGEVGVIHRTESSVVPEEIGVKTYYREFHLGDGIDHQAAQADVAEGVLTILLPKTDEVKSRTITIH